jgi:hypothetical protein
MKSVFLISWNIFVAAPPPSLGLTCLPHCRWARAKFQVRAWDNLHTANVYAAGLVIACFSSRAAV